MAKKRERNWQELRDIQFTKIAPKTRNHIAYVNAIERNTATFCTGPAGTGKTLLACLVGVKALKENKFEKIILTRPLVLCGEDPGHLPGDLKEKAAPYSTHLIDAFQQLLPGAELNELMETGKIQFTPIGYMRGSTFRRAYVILDEAQNCTYTQLRMFLTRAGDDTKLVINGDTQQRDMNKSGLADVVDYLSFPKPVDGCAFIEMEEEDIMRSKFVRDVERRLG